MLLATPVWPRGASLDDRVDAACQLNCVDPRSLLSRLGILDHGHVPVGWGRYLTPAHTEQLTTALHTAPANVASGLLDTYDQICFRRAALHDTPAVAINDAWTFLSGTRLCPHCWSATGIEPTRHRLPWSFACAVHQQWLLDTCQGCNRRFRAGKSHDRSGASILSLIPEPGTCTNQPGPTRTRPGLASYPCRHPYLANRTQPAPLAVLATQTVIDRALDGQPPAVLGQATSAIDFFDDLRSIAALCSPPAGHNDPRSRPFLTPPPTAQHMAAVCTVALEIVTQPCIDQAATTLLAHAEADLRRYQSTTLALLGRTRPTPRTQPILTAALAKHGRPTTRIRRSLQATLPLTGITLDDIDIHAATTLYPTHFEPIANQLGQLRRDLGILTAALDLTRLVGLSSYPAAAQHLHLEPRAPQQARYVRKRLENAGLISAWIRALDHAITALQPPAPARQQNSPEVDNST